MTHNHPNICTAVWKDINLEVSPWTVPTTARAARSTRTTGRVREVVMGVCNSRCVERRLEGFLDPRCWAALTRPS